MYQIPDSRIPFSDNLARKHGSEGAQRAMIGTILRRRRADCEVLTDCHDDGTRMTADDNTASLLARAGAGDRAVGASLVEQHAGLLWSVARRYRLDTATASDAIQTTWLRLVEH